jgi:class 3 adenylate cyclase/tetratricopeptide (TPR) repeat protein
MVLCRSCGEPNEPTARFCQACGEGLAEEPQPPLEVRKTVTVLFADVAGSTALGEQLDPEPLRRVMARYFEEMRAVLTHYGGTVEKFIGDAVMAVFGVPTVHEDDALRAIRAADQMQERLEELNRELEPEYGIRLEMRIGINMGEVVAGRASAGQTLVTGDAVNLAKRLEQAAPPGTILIGKSMYPLVKDAVEVGPLESFKVKGKAEAVSPLRLDAVDRLAAGVARRLDRPLIDRRDELAALQIAFGRAEVERSCRVFTLLGAAGIGKSRLMSEFVDWLGARATVLTGRCLPYGEGITFWPLREIVRALGGPSGVRSTLAGTADADFVAERVLAAVGASPDSARGEEAGWAFRKLFEVLAQDRPVVVVLEDIHWASATLLDLIEYLLGWTQAPVLLVCLARPDLVERRPGWLSLRPNVDALAVDRLSETDAETLLTQTLPAQLRRDEAGEGAVRRITEAAEGNPLFLEQMAAMLAESDGGDAALAVPPSIQALLAERLDQLSDDERAIIERAAVVGREFWRDAVVDLSSPSARAAVGSHLMALVRKELIRPDVSELAREDGFRFQHILIRDVAYEALPMSVRADLHERFARWLEENASEPELDVEEIMGYHLEQAFQYRQAVGPQDERVVALGARAAHHLGRAGQRALAGGDVTAAGNLFERATAALDESDPRRLDLLASLGMARTATGELEAALEVLGEAVERAEASGDRRTRCRAGVERARIGFLTGQIGPEEARAEAEGAISELEALEDDLGLAKAWLLLVMVHNWHLEYSALDRAADRARFHAQRAGGAHDAADALAWIAPATVLGPRPVVNGLEHMERIRSHADGPFAEAAALLSLGCLRLMGGQTRIGRDLYRRSEAIYRDLGLRLLAAAQATLTGWSELVAGDVATAETVLRTGYAELEEMGERGLLSSTAAELGRVLCERGSYDEADLFAATSEELSGPGDAFNAILVADIRARVLASKGDLEAASRAAQEAVTRAVAGDCLELTADAYRALADVLRASGQREAAEAALRAALALYEEKGNLVAAERVQQALAVSG